MHKKIDLIDPDGKIGKVLALLKSNEIYTNIYELITRQTFESGEIIVTRVINVRTCINEELIFSFKENKIQIILKNITLKYFDLSIFKNNLCVFCSVIPCGSKNIFSEDYQLEIPDFEFSESNLQSFKNGSWLNDIAYIAEYFRVNQKISYEKEHEQKKLKLLNNIDLDSNE